MPPEDPQRQQERIEQRGTVTGHPPGGHQSALERAPSLALCRSLVCLSNRVQCWPPGPFGRMGESLTRASPAHSFMPTSKGQGSHLPSLPELQRTELVTLFTLYGVCLTGLLGLSTHGDMHFTTPESNPRWPAGYRCVFNLHRVFRLFYVRVYC